MDATSLDQARQLTEQTVFLVGTSFLLGSLCTIFFLMMLDMLKMRRLRQQAGGEKKKLSYDDAASLEIDDAAR